MFDSAMLPIKNIVVLLLIVLPASCAAQFVTTYSNADTVNYTHVVFKLPEVTSAASYQLQLLGDGSDSLVVKTILPQVIVKDRLNFGRTYTWSYKCFDTKGKTIFTSKPFFLTIAGHAEADTTQYRIVVTTNKKTELTDELILLDRGIMTDRSGKVVWTFPPDKFQGVRCFRMTNKGTLTFLSNKAAYETDIRGNILWKSPDVVPGYKLIDYHHEFRKLNNGNYLCLVTYKDATDKTYSLVMELTPTNKPVWLWDERPHYIRDSSFKGSHLNAAWYDEKKQQLYISNRDLNSIAKIDVTDGSIIYSIGYNYNDGSAFFKPDLFNAQHAVAVMRNGNLLLFNNNSFSKLPTSVQVFKQPDKKHTPKLLWEYPLNFQDEKYNKVPKQGGAEALPDGHYLICMGANSKIIEVNNDKEIIWEADLQKYDSSGKYFYPIPSGYRGSYTPSLYPQLSKR